MKSDNEQPRGETKKLVDEQKRKRTYLAKEQELEKASDAKAAERAGKRADEETGLAAKDQARRKAMFAREQALSDAGDARKLKEKKNLPG